MNARNARMTPRAALTKIQEIALRNDHSGPDRLDVDGALNTILTICDAMLAPPEIPLLPVKQCQQCARSFQYSPQVLDHVCADCGEDVCPQCACCEKEEEA